MDIVLTYSGDYVPLGYWSTLEVHISIVIACLPSIRALFIRLFPNFSLSNARRTFQKSTGMLSSARRSSRANGTDNYNSQFSGSGKENFIPLKDGSNTSTADIEEQILQSVKKGMFA